jgi:TonB-linked SusC/RagA family outer membrane protein
MIGKTLRFLAGMALFPVLVLAQDATITGKVTDTAGNPLPGANVILELTNLGAATDANGNYHFTVPAKAVKGQKVRLTARFVGYRSKSDEFNLQAGAISKDFSLPQDVLDLDAIIVTGVLAETPKTKMPFSVAHVSDEGLKQVPASSPETALYGKVPGVRVVRGTGQPGTSASIQLRAPTSINTSGRSADPLYIVDGVVIDPSVSGSPLTDIPADDIESIEVVKGASGASVYGSRAANGVIRISTKRGNKLGLDQTKITVRNEFGKSAIAKKLDLNQHHNFKIATTSYTDSRGVNVTPGDFIDANGNWLDPRLPTRAEDVFATGISFYDKPYKYVATGAARDAARRLISPRDANGNIIPPTLLSAPFDHMDRFFDPGNFFSNTISISRNMENTNFSVSFGNRTEGGVVDDISGLNRKNLRVALDHKLRRSISLSLSGLYTLSNRDLVDGGDPFFALTFMAPDADLDLIDPSTGRVYVQPDPTSVEDNPLYFTRYNDRDDQRKRVLGSFGLRYDPVDWFNLEGNLSFDRSDRNNELFWPIGYESVSLGPEFTGQYYKGNFSDQALNGGMTASFSRRFGSLILRARAQGVFERTEYNATDVQGNSLAVQGVRNLGASASDARAIGSLFEQVRSSGYSGIVAFDYKDRYIGDVHVRRDGSSLFGEEDRWHTYYRASGAYRISQESFWFLPLFEEFKLRGSYGTAGGRPRFNARYETWSVSGGSVSKANLGNKLLRPEFAKELELGVDTAFLNRFTLDVTYARSNVDDQILFVPLPGYAGYRNQWQNAGTLKTNTIEASLNASILRSSKFNWRVGLNFDRTNQKISKLTIPEYRTGPFLVREGESLGAMFGDRWIKSLSELPSGLPQDQFNVNDDGYVVWVGAGKTFRDGIAQKLWGTSATLTDDRKVGHTFRWGIPIKFSDPVFDSQGNFLRYQNFVKIGETQPDFNLGFHSDFRWKNVHVYTVLDAQIGGDIYNNTVQWGLRENKHGIVDQSGKPDELKKPGLYYQVIYNVNAVNSHFVENGTYMKLRELAVTYTFQQKALSRVFGGLMDKLSIGVVGRNLLTFTDYSGYDPETGSTGFSIGNATVARFDGFGYPNFRTITGIIEFDF